MIKEPTSEQKNIIEYIGNIVVTANPGSGKTYTIVEKICKIIPELPDYKGVIAISFTNKASDELKKRCRNRCSDTKQSFFGTIDKFYISQIIIPFACHITGTTTEYRVVNDIEEDSKYAELKSGKNKNTSLDYKLLVEGLREGLIFLEYTGETALYLLEKVPGVIRYLKARYSHIIIDEYQDCGKIQDKIFITLVENGLNGIAVGDINQAIYGFAGRFPRYLFALIARDDFTHFELKKNHRCHPGITEYSLCLFNSSRSIPSEKRVFKVNINGGYKEIAVAIDSYIEKIKEKYSIKNNNEIAILCRNNRTIAIMHDNLHIPCKVYNETELDKDDSDWGRLFRNIILGRFDSSIFAVDFIEQFFSIEYEPSKYRLALSLCESIFSYSFEEFSDTEEKIISFAKLVYPDKEIESAVDKMRAVLYKPELLKNYLPAEKNEINLMTLHKAKGLEFNIVFHMDMYKWVIPNEYGNDKEKQQDLNLHYVGITRAKDVCYIMNGNQRYIKSKDDYGPAEPSPFLYLPGLAERRLEVEWR